MSKGEAQEPAKENKVESEYLPGVGVDVGTANIVTCRQKKDESFEVKFHRNMLFEMDASDDAVDFLERGNYLYIKNDNKYYIIGEDALTVVNALGRGEIIRPMKEGLMNPEIKKAQDMLNFILKTIVGEPTEENEPLRFSIPANPVDVPDKNNMFHEIMLKTFFSNLGFDAKSVNEARACIYNEAPVMKTEEGEEWPLTGWGISCGGGMVNSCIAVRGLPVVEFSITKSGDYIDQQTHMVTNERLSVIIKAKEKKLDLENPKMGDNVLAALSVYYDEFMNRIIRQAVEELKKTSHSFEGPVPVVICGGTSLAPGFIDRFNQHIKNFDMPFEIADIKLSETPFFSVAQGSCLTAMSDFKKRGKK